MLKCPFPYFGGKSKVANLVWDALGQPKHYIEPFFGSGAVLLLRPDYHTHMTETVCDKDGFICNVWRSLKYAPDTVAEWCDWPVNHADLCSRKKVLIANEERLLENLIKDDDWFDPKLAGYWIWAASCWIGGGLTCPNQRPHVSHAGMGINALGQRPHVSHAGMGINEPVNTNLWDWFRKIQERFRHVRVVCGDWTRVCGGKWQDKIGICGMFFDPPYGVTDRAMGVYHHNSTTVAAEVVKWCAERGGNNRYRIILAGYEEHTELVENHGWRSVNWTATGGYSGIARQEITQGKENRKREMLYFSPHCLAEAETTKEETNKTPGLFGVPHSSYNGWHDKVIVCSSPSDQIAKMLDEETEGK